MAAVSIIEPSVVVSVRSISSSASADSVTFAAIALVTAFAAESRVASPEPDLIAALDCTMTFDTCRAFDCAPSAAVFCSVVAFALASTARGS